MVLLLASCGLEEATMFSDEYHWREAIDRSWLGRIVAVAPGPSRD